MTVGLQTQQNMQPLTSDGQAAVALGMVSSLIGQVDAVVGFVSLLDFFDSQGEDIVSLGYYVLAALKYGVVVLQPLGLCSLCVDLTVQHDLLTFFALRVF